MSSYVYNNGSRPSQWGLATNSWHKVNAVASNPAHWGEGDPTRSDGPNSGSNHGRSILFILDNAKDSLSDSAGNALFPKILRSEFHGIRATIEAYSRRATIAGRDEATACGIMLGKGSAWDARFRVTNDGLTMEYRLDRWD